ncbi:MAG: fimbrillin family protein [Bacteroidales bacterium]|nr:fimbrillin family protein [Bacteroidales bacterium]
MKKLFLLSAAALMVLASCTKDEVDQTPDQKITFSSPVVSVATKANVPGEIVKYPDGEQFKVFAVHHESTFDTWKDKHIYMKGVTCTYDNTDKNWQPSPSYYWPKVGKLTFAAYSPAVADGTFAYGEGGLTINGYTTPEVSKQYDLLYSERTYNRTTSSDSATDEGEDQGKDYKGVDIKFNHALSSIVFTVKTSEDYSDGATITLKNITLNNINSHGNFTENVTEGATYASNPTWTSATPIDYSPIIQTSDKPFSQIVNSGTAQTITNAHPLLMIPQNLNNAKVTVVYTIKSHTSEPIEQTQEIVLSTVDHDTSKDEVQAEWILGKRYTYVITIALNKIYFDPYVETWKDVTLTSVPVL